ncbi:GNAT family N-acetyltransferase [Polymorphospora sp. NPDC050346]|uniref:GNAT family N-acetyltransferase n=1 Tax=Polymorphospora sp. NPDC050346 TaxID=3155780 RepID=UPI0033D5E09C
MADDAAELVRLRGLMLRAMGIGEPGAENWQPVALRSLRDRLAEPDGSLVAFVVDQPAAPDDQPVDPADAPAGSTGPPRLAACVVGVVERRLGTPDNPSGEIGYVFNVSTEPGHRRRGYSRALLAALLDWYRGRGIMVVDLVATGDGEPLYRLMGFAPSAMPLMHLTLPTDPGGVRG